jgi:hypothetical protein
MNFVVWDLLFNIVRRNDAASQAANSKQPDGLRQIASGVPAGEVGSSSTFHIAQEAKVVVEDDNMNENIAQAMSLLLAARGRVLTLSEQRVSQLHQLSSFRTDVFWLQLLVPAIPQLFKPPMITSSDLGPLISNNPTLAHPVIVALLTQPPSKLTSLGLSTYLDVLKHMPPTLSSIDLLGRLLHDPTEITDFTTGGRITVADLICIEVLGRFIHESINWLDNAEREEREGLVSDDRFAKGVQNVGGFNLDLLQTN